jgi:hypothetical protein
MAQRQIGGDGESGGSGDGNGGRSEKKLAKGHVPSFLRLFLFTSRGELILVRGLGREELFEVLAATAAMVVT